MSFSKNPISPDRILNAVDQTRRAAKKSGTPVFSFFIDDHFYNVFDIVPDKTDSQKGQFVIKGIKRCFFDLYYHFPSSYIGCYDEHGDRKWMIKDFTEASQEMCDED